MLVLVLVANSVPLMRPILECLRKTPGDDEVVLSERKLESLRQLLPPLVVAGYMADDEVKKGSLFSLDSCRRFYMTQYALAPHIVVHDTKARFVIGNFSSSENAHEAVRLYKLQVIKDFGDGLILMSSPGAP
jgi:hypothetical protein